MEFKRIENFLNNCDFDDLQLIDEFIYEVHKIIMERMASCDV